MIVEKAVRMAEMMNIPILGLIENMSYIECPDCGKKISVFGESHIEEAAAAHSTKVLGRLPIRPEFASAVDAGAVEGISGGDRRAGRQRCQPPIESAPSGRRGRLPPAPC